MRNLFVAPASLDLAGGDRAGPRSSREMRLKSALAEVVDAYDFVMIDCPPSLGLLTVNGLAAAEAARAHPVRVLRSRAWVSSSRTWRWCRA